MPAPDHMSACINADAALEQLASMALSEHSLHSVLQCVADMSSKVLPGGVEASVTLLVADRATTMVFTGPLALALDESQYGRGYGPCLHAAGIGETVLVKDARTDPRWPDYMRRAVELGSLSSMAIPLGSPQQMGAALNVYAREVAAFHEESQRTVHRFARFAGVVVANMHAYQNARELADSLEMSMAARAVIEQAKGVLVERHNVTPDEAYTLLAQTSLGANRRLRDVADHLMRTGELPLTQSR